VDMWTSRLSTGDRLRFATALAHISTALQEDF
jgi:hypothetical protein